MKARDPQPLAKVKRMRILALRPGVKAEGIAAGFPGQCDKPLQHRLAVALRTRRRMGHQIIDVERLPTRQHVLYAESRDRNNGVFVFQKGKLIPFGLLGLDASAKLFSDQHGPKLAHHKKATINLFGRSGDLDSPHASFTSFLWRADA
jgi:hypothetical protein